MTPLVLPILLAITSAQVDGAVDRWEVRGTSQDEKLAEIILFGEDIINSRFYSYIGIFNLLSGKWEGQPHYEFAPAVAKSDGSYHYQEFDAKLRAHSAKHFAKFKIDLTRTGTTFLHRSAQVTDLKEKLVQVPVKSRTFGDAMLELALEPGVKGSYCFSAQGPMRKPKLVIKNLMTGARQIAAWPWRFIHRERAKVAECSVDFRFHMIKKFANSILVAVEVVFAGPEHDDLDLAMVSIAI